MVNKMFFIVIYSPRNSDLEVDPFFRVFLKFPHSRLTMAEVTTKALECSDTTKKADSSSSIVSDKVTEMTEMAITETICLPCCRKYCRYMLGTKWVGEHSKILKISLTAHGLQ